MKILLKDYKKLAPKLKEYKSSVTTCHEKKVGKDFAIK